MNDHRKLGQRAASPLLALRFVGFVSEVRGNVARTHFAIHDELYLLDDWHLDALGFGEGKNWCNAG
jgi:hypothetical protein